MAAPDRLPVDQQPPRSIGASEVTGLEADTQALRATDYRHGGESCLTALDALLRAGDQTLTASASAKIRRRLHVALADLHDVAGWAYFDAGFTSKARTRFCQAVVPAGLGGTPG